MDLAYLAMEAQDKGISLGELAVRLESEETGKAPQDIRSKVSQMLAVMKEAVRTGLSSPTRSRSGLSGMNAARMAAWLDNPSCLPSSRLLAKALAYSLAVSEVNACMGKIVAAPTAGSSGVIPGTLLAVAEEIGAGETELIDALCAAGIVGQVIGDKASLSGAQAGCQAECGSAAAMAAAALVQLRGGTPRQAIHAAAIALKGLLGLVCDPVAGLVEVPCVKRNATSAAIALAAAEMALAGIESFIPPDEVVEAMAQVGRLMPESLKETAGGGLAATSTAVCVKQKLMR